jgi:amino-acid N-acetyltransferase
MTELISAANLPAIFIEEFLDGFVAAEREGELVGCGGVETYGDCAVIRSVAVDGAARGLGIGRRIAEMLMEQHAPRARRTCISSRPTRVHSGNGSGSRT